MNYMRLPEGIAYHNRELGFIQLWSEMHPDPAKEVKPFINSNPTNALGNAFRANVGYWYHNSYRSSY